MTWNRFDGTPQLFNGPGTTLSDFGPDLVESDMQSSVSTNGSSVSANEDSSDPVAYGFAMERFLMEE